MDRWIRRGDGNRGGRLSPALVLAPMVALALQAGGCAGSSAPSAGDGGGGDNRPVVRSCGTPDGTFATASAAELFAETSVPTFQFYLPQAEWEALKVNARDEQFVPVEACFDGKPVGTVGLRFKGSYGSLFECFDAQGKMICPRLSMKVKFDEYVAGQRFFGLKRLAFNAYLHDDSRIKEKLAYDLFRTAGIVAPRAAWAVLRVNDELLGVFGMVEPVDGRFTSDRWPNDGDRNLYKELWPTLASDAKIQAALETNEETGDISAYRAFAQAVVSADAATLPATVDSYMSLDYLARFMAVEDALASYDGTTYFWTDGVDSTNHNYFVYEESATRFTLIPWDVEATFWINPDHTTPHWTERPADCKTTYPYWGGLAYAPGCDRVFQALMADPSKWRAAARALLDGPFSVAAMNANIDRHVQLIAAAIAEDPTPPKYSTFSGAVGYLRTTIVDLRARLEKLIAK